MIRHGVFVDTSAWGALADAGDQSHPAARAAYTRLRADSRRLVTTNHVVAESYTLILRRGGHQAAQAFLQRIGSSGLTDRVFVVEQWEREAEALLRKFEDQPFSYVDATSFVAMRRLGLREAFAFDQHFSTAGFALLS